MNGARFVTVCETNAPNVFMQNILNIVFGLSVRPGKPLYGKTTKRVRCDFLITNECINPTRYASVNASVSMSA